MDVKKVVLINPPLHYADGLPSSLDATVPPLGIMYVASYINEYSKDFKASIIDVSAEQLTLGQIAARIKKDIPFVVGITAMTPQLQGTVELARFLKDKNPDLKIFLGGSHISGDPDFINRYSDLFDYAITGEGEKTFLDSLALLLKGKKIPKIQSGQIITDLDTIPVPDRSLIDKQSYDKHESMIFSRGCPYKCYYCSRPAVSNKVRYRSVSNMIDEIEMVYEHCGGIINIQDDSLTINKKKVHELCEEIINRKLKLEWECNTRIDLVTDELLGIMKKAGCSLIHFGIESGNEGLRKNQIQKGNFSNKRIKEVFGLCRKHGIKIACYFMLGHPGETKETLEETRQMILKSGIDVVGVSIPTPFPGSDLYDISEKAGIINNRTVDSFAEKRLGEGYIGNYPVYIPSGIQKEYLYGVMQNINRKFYINFKTFWQTCKKDIMSPKHLKKDAIDLVSLIVKGVSSRKPYTKKKNEAKKHAQKT